MTAAGDVVELVAEVAVADVLRPEREGELQEKLDGGEEEGEPRAARRERSQMGRTTVELIWVKENVPKLTRRFPRKAFSR